MALVLSEEQKDLLIHVKEEPPVDEFDLESDVLHQVVAAENNQHASNNHIANGRNFKTSKLPLVKNRRHIAQGLPSCHQWLFHLTALAHIFLGLALLVTLSSYSRSSNQLGSDGFSILFFVMSITTLVLALLMALRKFWVPNFSLFGHMPVKTIVRDSFAFAFSILGLCYAREKNRVPCHLQDGLFFLAIPISIVYMSMKKKRGMYSFNETHDYYHLNNICNCFTDQVTNREIKLMGYLTAIMSFVFLGVVPQLSYR